MNATLQNIVTELDQLVDALNSSMTSDEPFGTAHNNWSFPGLTRSELVETTKSIAVLIRECSTDDIAPHEKRLADYVRRLTFLRTSTVPNLWANAAVGVPTYLLTLDGLSKALSPVLRTTDEVASESRQAAQRVAKRLRALETRLSDAEPRTGKISEMVERIEHAYEAADQLPADLQSLSEDREKIKALLKAALTDSAEIHNATVAAAASASDLSDKKDQANSVLKRCESAYSAATSQGLAAAFAERSAKLATSMWIWTTAFIVALVTGAFFGTQRVHEIGALLQNPAMTNWALGISLLLATLSVGAPIWFGWLATKQINQRFRLSEDYAFKASVSRAYEGYRREAARVDKDMEAQLLASALARLDEQPLRLVERENHGSPWHELASSEIVKNAMRSVPGFAGDVMHLARSGVSALAAAKASSAESPKLKVASTSEALKAEA